MLKVTILILAILVLHVFVQYDVHTGPGPMDMASDISTGLLFFFISMFYFFIYMNYLYEWERLGCKLICKIMKYICMPLVIITWPSAYSLMFYIDSYPLLVLFIYVIWTFTVSDAVKYVPDLIPITDIEKKKLFSVYPPKQRSDMLALDAIVIATVVMPFVYPYMVYFD